MNFHIISLFPNSMSSYVKESIIGRAIIDKKIKVKFYNPREFTRDKWRRIDQKPYGGGPGMVIQAEPVIKAIKKAIGRNSKNKNTKIIFLSPSGKQFDTNLAKKYASQTENLIIIAGRYEGIDERVNKVFKTEKVSVGPYVLTGGELPALIILDSVSRQLKGVLGNSLSPEEKRVSSSKVYTRPPNIVIKGKKFSVPTVLLGGNHQKIDEWRAKNR